MVIGKKGVTGLLYGAAKLFFSRNEHMPTCKYVIIRLARSNIEVAMVFSEHITHKEIGTRGESRGEVVAAGFCQFVIDKQMVENLPIVRIQAKAYGESYTLDLKSRGDIDSDIISRDLCIT